jgi:hypothetical protein
MQLIILYIDIYITGRSNQFFFTGRSKHAGYNRMFFPLKCNIHYIFLAFILFCVRLRQHEQTAETIVTRPWCLGYIMYLDATKAVKGGRCSGASFTKPVLICSICDYDLGH